MVTYVRALPCVASKIKSMSTERTFPKTIKENKSYWVPFTESWVRERNNMNYNNFIQIDRKINEWIIKEKTEDLKAAREKLKKNLPTISKTKAKTVTKASSENNTKTTFKRQRSQSFEAAERWTNHVTHPQESHSHSSSMFQRLAKLNVEKRNCGDGTKSDDSSPEYPSPASLHDIPWMELKSSDKDHRDVNMPSKKKQKIGDEKTEIVGSFSSSSELRVIIPPTSEKCFR